MKRIIVWKELKEKLNYVERVAVRRKRKEGVSSAKRMVVWRKPRKILSSVRSAEMRKMKKRLRSVNRLMNRCRKRSHRHPVLPRLETYVNEGDDACWIPRGTRENNLARYIDTLQIISITWICSASIKNTYMETYGYAYAPAGLSGSVRECSEDFQRIYFKAARPNESLLAPWPTASVSLTEFGLTNL